MPYLLENLVINRVDLVDEGANSASFIELYKRKEQGNKMDLQEIISKMTPEHAEIVKAEIAKLSDTTELEKAKEDLKAVNEELDKTKSELNDLKESSAESKDDEEEVLKSMPASAKELYVKMKAQKEAAEEAVRKAKEAEDNATAVAKAAELKAIPVEQEKMVGILKGASPELIEVLTAINAAVEKSVLGELGTNNPGSSATSAKEAWDKIEAKALVIAKASNISKAKAITQAVDENPDLYKEYLKGGAN